MRSRNSLMRERLEAFRDARLIVIASEGKDTERIYFKALAKEYTNPRVHVHILERSEAEQNNSSPEHVLKQLNDYKEQYALEADDELWLVIDKDRWTEAMLSRVATECAQDEYMHMAFVSRRATTMVGESSNFEEDRPISKDAIASRNGFLP